MKRIFAVLVLLTVVLSISGQEKFRDKRDGNIYNTLSVQGYTWMAENLKYKSQVGSVFFDRDSSNSKGYGVLYDWKTASKACPDGWRLPTGAEFQMLVIYNDQKDSWNAKKSNPDSFGIQLAGMQDYEGTFTEMEESAYFWTSSEYDKDNAEYVSYLLINDNPVVDVSRIEDISDIHGTEKSNKYSVRCVKTR